MTIGYSSLVVTVLSQIPRSIQFELLVTEQGPYSRGHEMIQACLKHGIHATLITDESVYGVSKDMKVVYIGCTSVLPNGGIMT